MGLINVHSARETALLQESLPDTQHSVQTCTSDALTNIALPQIRVDRAQVAPG